MSGTVRREPACPATISHVGPVLVAGGRSSWPDTWGDEAPQSRPLRPARLSLSRLFSQGQPMPSGGESRAFRSVWAPPPVAPGRGLGLQS